MREIQSQKTTSFEENAVLFVKSALETLLTDMGFHEVDFSFENIVPDPGFRSLIEEFYAGTEIGRILISSPDLFVMHRKKEPREGVFFLKLIALPRENKPKVVRVQEEILEIFNRYYPKGRIAIIVITGEARAPLLASWLGKNSKIDLSKMRDFDKFIYDNLSIEVNQELFSKLSSEIIKMYKI